MFLLLLLAGQVFSQNTLTGPAHAILNATTRRATAPATAVDETKLKAMQKAQEEIFVKKVSIEDDNGRLQDGSAGLGDVIVMKVRGLKRLLTTAKCQDTAGAVKSGCIVQDVMLFINDRMIDGISPESGAPDTSTETLRFHLQRSSKNDEEWADLLGKPINPFFYKYVHFSVGLSGGYAEKSVAPAFRFTRIRVTWFWCCLLIAVAYFILLIIFGRSKNFLRDAGIDLSAIGVAKVPQSPYSMAKLQMAFWFSIVLLSFLFIWLITGNYDMLTPGVLGLIGISSVTALGAVAIDSSKGQEAVKQIIALQTQEAGIIQTIQGLQVQLALTASTASIANSIQYNKNAQAEIKAQIDSTIAGLNIAGSGNILVDILEDVNGVSFHRLQMLIWTLVLGIIFFYSVWSRLFMPEFSAAMLVLQGISSGTYLGFKFPEKQA